MPSPGDVEADVPQPGQPPITAGPSPEVGGRSEVAPAPELWPLWEVFVRANRGLSHVHVGSLHAPDADTRRNEGVSIWVVPADAITTSDPDAKGAFFESPAGKNYRHAVYYTKSEGVKHL